MTLDRHLRLVLALLVVIGLVLVMAALLFVTESALEVWQRLREGPRWILVAWLGGIGMLMIASGWAVWRLAFPRRAARPAPEEALDEEGIGNRMAAASARGVDVSGAERELALLAQRREAGDVRVVLLGEISTGKSALIRALLPPAAGAAIEVNVRGGSTRQITDYVWTSPAGDRLILTDVPGLNEPAGGLSSLARDEALRAHVVVYVCDNDLTREQYTTVTQLRALEKPMVLALNKADRFDPTQLGLLKERLEQRARDNADEDVEPLEVVAVSAAPAERIVRVLPDGSEETTTREHRPDVGGLREALQVLLDRDPEAMEVLRDASVFVLARRELDRAEDEFRTRRSAELVTSYTRKAVVGAMAAVAPGTDVLIQGYLGANFVRELCELYAVPVRDIDVQQFLKLSQKHIGKAMPILLAVGGNVLKAFPGIGTVAGGLMHAVAYGLIFDTLGRSLDRSLREHGRLRPAPAATLFGKRLGQDLETRTIRVAKLALAARREDRDA